MKTVVSVDFDFFVRENPIWDMGHREDKMFHNSLWVTRYSSMDLYGQTDIEKYADFSPKWLMKNLQDYGFKFDNEFPLFVAESHKEAYKVCQDIGRCRLYNFDAHHDLWKPREKYQPAQCDDWVYKLIEDGLISYYEWIAPTWGKEFKMLDDFKPTKKQRRYVNSCYWDNFSVKDVKVDALFICHSPAWVPPHLDETFVDMIKWTQFFHKPKLNLIGELYKRKAPTPEEAKKAFEQMQELMKNCGAKNKEIIEALNNRRK